MSLGVVVIWSDWQKGSCPTGVIVLRGNCPKGSCPKGSCPRGRCPRTVYMYTCTPHRLLHVPLLLRVGGHIQPPPF